MKYLHFCPNINILLFHLLTRALLTTVTFGTPIILLPLAITLKASAEITTCSLRQINEKCQITFRADAGSCSKQKGCNRDSGPIENAVPTGYAVVNWTQIDDSWNGGSFNVHNISRGQRTYWNQAYQSLSETFQQTKFKLDYLSREATEILDIKAKSEIQRKIDILSSDLNRIQNDWKMTSRVDTNIDAFRLQAKSWYECTMKDPLFGKCLDGRGNHGKGRVVVDLVYIGDEAQIMSSASSLRQQTSSLEAEMARLKTINPPPSPPPSPEILTRTQLRDHLINGLVNKGYTSEQVTPLCNCVAKDVFERYTSEQLIQLSQNQAQLQAVVTPIIQDCKAFYPIGSPNSPPSKPPPNTEGGCLIKIGNTCVIKLP